MSETLREPPESDSNAAAKLRGSRDQLLDLTLRNRLLNFPQGDPNFKERDNRIHKNLPLSARLDRVWERLVADEKPVKIISGSDDATTADEIAEIIAAGEVYAHADEEHVEKRLQKLLREQQTLESSTGDSAFFLALGFLEWREAPPKEVRTLFAPLLLLHVRISRKSSQYGGRRAFQLEMDADEHSGNPSLDEKLKAEHNIVIPSTREITSPEAYLRQVETAIQSKPLWRVHRTAAFQTGTRNY